MQTGFVFGVSLAAALLTTSAWPEWSGYARDCAERSSHMAWSRLRACTKAITSGQLSSNELSSTFNNRAIAWHDMRDYEAAIADHSEAIRLNPLNADAFFYRGDALSEKGDYRRAIDDYNEVYWLNPKHANTLAHRGHAWYFRGYYDRAIADYNEIIRLNPGNIDVLYDRAIAWDAKGDYDHAIADYNEVIRLNSKYGVAFNNRAYAWEGKGDHDRAILDYDEAIRLNPKFRMALTGRGNVWRAKGDNDRAIADYNETIRVDPKWTSAFYDRGILKYYQGQYTAATADFDEIVKHKPRSGDAVLWRYLSRARSASPTTAKEELESKLTAVALGEDKTWATPLVELFIGDIDIAAARKGSDTDDPVERRNQPCKANFFIGQFYLLNQKTQEAQASLKAAQDGCPRAQVNAYAVAAELRRLSPPANAASAAFPAEVVLVSSNSLAELTNDAHKCARKNSTPDRQLPACTRAITSGQLSSDELSEKFKIRADAWRAKREYDSAVADYSEAIRLNPGYINAFLGRGRAWIFKDDYDRAISDYNEVIRLDQNIANAFYGRGQAWHYKDDYDHAIADYNEAIRLDQTSTYLDRGVIEFNRGDFSKAAADFDQRLKYDGFRVGYAFLWRYLARARSEGLAAAKKELEVGLDFAAMQRKWPTQLIYVYLEVTDSDTARRAIDTEDLVTRRSQACEADFFIGELYLLNQRTQEARVMLKAAQDGCPSNAAEVSAAASELKRPVLR